MSSISKKLINTNQVEQGHLLNIMRDVISLIRKEGASDANVAIQHDQGFSVDVRMREVETVAFHEDKSIGLTVYFGHRKGSASSTDLSPAAIHNMIQAACDIAKVSAEDPCFGLPDKELMTNDFPDLDLYHPWDIQPSEALGMALECEEKAMAYDPRISNSDGVNISNHQFCHGFLNTRGGEGFVRGTRHSISCSLIAKEGDQMQRDYDYTTGRNSKQLMLIDELAKSTAARTTSRLGAKPIKTQKAPVLFSSRVSHGLLSSFINAISGGNLYRKSSFLLNSIGQQIFPESFQIYEQPHLLGALGSSAFDSEGVPTRSNVFVKDGRVQQYVLGSYSARRLGLKTTANSGGVHNLTLDPTAGDFKDMLRLLDRGLLVTELMGQGVNGLTGDYSRGAAGFWVENGEIQFPVEEVTIAGNLKDLFPRIRAVGNDINLNIATRCGSLLLDDMMIAGR